MWFLPTFVARIRSALSGFEREPKTGAPVNALPSKLVGNTPFSHFDDATRWYGLSPIGADLSSLIANLQAEALKGRDSQLFKPLTAPVDVNLFAQATVLGKPDTAGAPSSSSQPPAAPTEILVQFSKGATAAEKQAAIASVKGTVKEVVRAEDAYGGDLILVKLPSAAAAGELETISRSPGVRFAEPNWSVGAQAISNDPHFSDGSLWGMYGDGTSPANSFGSQAGEAWASDYVGKSTVVVGNIDTGIDYTHPDLFLNIWLNQGELPQGMTLQDTDSDGLITFRDLNNSANSGAVSDLNRNGRIDAGDLLNDARWENGTDQDGNGYVDDLIGWDFVNNDNDPYDDNGHGTHTAGTIGAVGGNSVGVAGVNWNVQIMSLKFLSASGSGTTAGAIKALDYYTTASTIDQTRGWSSEFVATNNSWGGGGYSLSMSDAIVRSARQDALFIAAAGNGGSDGVGDNNDAVANYPSNYSTQSSLGFESVVAVAALTSSGGLASYSNYGPTTVDIGAPGSAIRSTAPGGGYATYSGTSMASPHVTGAIALYASKYPTANAAQLRSALMAGAAPTSSLANKTVSGGRLDVGAMLNGAGPAPAPSGVTIYGTTKNDNINGSNYADTLSGVPAAGADLGRGTIDTLTGREGKDLFVLGDARGRFYDDGRANNSGRSDYALINDFIPGSDKIQLKAGAYFLSNTTVNGVSGAGIFFDSNGNGSLGNLDEMIGLVKGVPVASLSTGDFTWA